MKISHQLVVEAILLAVRDVAHADRMVTLFSRQLGKLQAVAYGSRLGKSRLGGCLQPFSAVRLSINVNENAVSTIKQCEVCHSFRELREDMERFSYATVIAELACELWPERQSDPSVYDTLLAAFTTMSCRNPRLTALACGWQLIAQAGFLPHYKECLSCGTSIKPGFTFNVMQGGAVCPACQGESAAEFGPEMAALLHTLLYLNWQQPEQFTVPRGTLESMERLFEEYVTHQLEKPLKSFAFIRQLSVCHTGDK